MGDGRQRNAGSKGLSYEVRMMNARRKFLAAFLGAGAVALLRTGMLEAQSRGAGQTPVPDPKEREDSLRPDKPATKAMLEANEKDIKKSVEKLYQLASDLKAEVDKTDSSQVLSLALVKKAEEIEKLAKDIRTRAKG